MLMFTEPEVLRLKTLSNVGRLVIPSVDWPVYSASQSDLEMQDLRDYYNSYLAAGHIEVYNPVSDYQSCPPLSTLRSRIIGSEQV
jgi:hypothetical protein